MNEDIAGEYLIIRDAEIVNDDIWFFSLERNMLFCKNMTSGKIIFGEPFKENYIYSSMINVNGMIYFAPLMTPQICIFDIERKLFNYIDLPIGCSESWFDDIFVFENSIIMVDRKNPILLCIDIEKNTTSCIYIKIEAKKNKEGFWTGEHGCIYEEKVYIPLIAESGYLSVNLKSFQVEKYMFDKEYGFFGLHIVNGDVWCTPYNTCYSIIISDISGGIKKEISFNKLVQPKDVSECGIWSSKETVYLFMQEIDASILCSDIKMVTGNQIINKKHNKCYHFNTKSLLLEVFDERLDTVQYYNLSLDKQWCIRRDLLINETKKFTLNDYVDCVTNNF